MNLTKEIEKMKNESGKKMPENIIKIMKKSAEALGKRGIEKSPLKVGDLMPKFTLKNAVGKSVSLEELLDNGPLVINFYRGAWCPYCNLELKAYQEILTEIEALGGQLLAVSPELPDNSLSLMEKHSLKFEVLSDIDNKVAKEFGIVFTVEEELRKVYEKFGIDLATFQGNQNFELPVPATYVVDTNGKIVLSYINTDYTTRLDPTEVLKVL